MNPYRPTMRVNLGQVDLSDETEALLKVAAALNDTSLRAYVANALNGFMKRHEASILQSVRRRARKYGIPPKEAMERLYTGRGFDDLTVVDPTPFELNEPAETSSFFTPGTDQIDNC